MNLSRHLCPTCGDAEALFVGIVSRCCGWRLPVRVKTDATFNNERSSGRPPKLSDVERREMRIKRAQGIPVRTIAAQAGMSVSQTRVICRDVQLPAGKGDCDAGTQS